MTAVTDATTSIYLLRIGEEQIFDNLFDDLILPDGVARELAHKPAELDRLILGSVWKTPRLLRAAKFCTVLHRPAQNALALATAVIFKQTLVSCIRVHPTDPSGLPPLALPHAHLQAGGISALKPAMRLRIPDVIVDDLDARIVATRRGLQVTGLLGVSSAPKATGHLAEVKPIVDRVRSAGFSVGEKLYRRHLRSERE